MSNSTGADLALLKTDLGFIGALPKEMLTYLQQKLDAAQDELTHDGIALNIDENASDMELKVMYAAWLYRKRITNEPMPPMLRLAINNHKTRPKPGPEPNPEGDA